MVLVLTLMTVCRVAAAAAEECLLTMSAGGFGIEPGKEIDFHAVFINEHHEVGTALKLYVRYWPGASWASDVQSITVPDVGQAVNVAFTTHFAVPSFAKDGWRYCFKLVVHAPGGQHVECGQEKCTIVQHHDMQANTNTSDRKLMKSAAVTKDKKLALPDLVVGPTPGINQSIRVTNQSLNATKLACTLLVKGTTANNTTATDTFEVPPLAAGGFKDFNISGLLFIGGSLSACVDSHTAIVESNEDNNCYPGN